MKTTIFQSVFCILVTATTVLSSCQKEDTIISGSVSGELTLFDRSAPLAKTPASGIKIYLIDNDFNFDQINLIGNQRAILDSTISNANGKYGFFNLPFGNYFVVPATNLEIYRFEPETNSNFNSILISQSKLNYTLNFISPLLANENIDISDNKDSMFETSLILKNEDGTNFVTIRRQSFLAFIPAYSDVENKSTPTYYSTSDRVINFRKEKGIAFFVWLFPPIPFILTSNFLIETYNSKKQYIYSYWITWPDINAPATSTWEIDWTAKTILRTK